MLDRPPSRRARWQREYRQRQRSGTIVVPVEIDADTVGFLIRTKWLVEADAADRRKIGLALAAMLRDAAKG